MKWPLQGFDFNYKKYKSIGHVRVCVLIHTQSVLSLKTKGPFHLPIVKQTKHFDARYMRTQTKSLIILLTRPFSHFANHKLRKRTPKKRRKTCKDGEGGHMAQPVCPSCLSRINSNDQSSHCPTD